MGLRRLTPLLPLQLRRPGLWADPPAIMAAYPEADRIRCYEYSVDDEYAREVAPLLRSGEKWLPAV